MPTAVDPEKEPKYENQTEVLDIEVVSITLSLVHYRFFSANALLLSGQRSKTHLAGQFVKKERDRKNGEY